MSTTIEPNKNADISLLHDKNNYQIIDLDSEIRADRFCADLLKVFHQQLLKVRQLEPLEAGSQAAGADYFLREFMIGKCRKNIFAVTAQDIRQFAGNWYIVSNLEPNLAELQTMLAGADSFSQYCAGHKLVTPDTAEQISAACSQLDYFQQRIDDFHNISGDGFSTWDKECPLNL